MDNTNITTTETANATTRSYNTKQVAGIGALAFLAGAAASAGYRKAKQKFFSGEAKTNTPPAADAAATPAQ